MSDTPPVPGQEPWGDDLNEYLAALESTVEGQASTIAQHTSAITAMGTAINDLSARVEALEDKPEYVFNSYAWMYSNQAPPPTGSQVRFDNADLTLATVAVFRLIDADGADRTAIFQQLHAGSLLRINDWDDSATLHRFNVTGPANIAASDVTVPVTWVSGAGTLPNTKANVAFLVPLIL